MTSQTNIKRVIRMTVDGHEAWVTDETQLVFDELRLLWEEQGEEEIKLEYTWISQEDFDSLPDFEGY